MPYSLSSHLDAAIFDPAQFDVLMELREEGDDDLLKEIVAQFVHDSLALLHVLDTEVEAKNLPQVALAAHSMKGGTSTLGLMRATHFALQIETAARSGEEGDLDRLRRLLDEAFAQGRQEMEKYAGRFWQP